MSDRFYPPPEWRQAYPETDGNPTAEHSGTLDWLMRLYANFVDIYRRRKDVTVNARLFWYACEGRPQIRHAPHLMIAFGRPPLNRMAYLQWLEEGIAPQVAFEIDPRLETEGRQAEIFEFYERYGVEEYYRYDWMFGELLGWRRSAEGTLVRIPEMNGWTSPRLHLRFELCERELRLIRPDGREFVSLVEMIRQRECAQDDQETQAMKQEIADIQAEIDGYHREIEVMRQEISEIEAERRRLAAEEARMRAILQRHGVVIEE